MENILGRDKTITFDPVKHRYFNRATGCEYTPVSRVIDSITKPFDKDGISINMARGELGRGSGTTRIIERAEEIKKDWKKIGDDTSDHGTEIHDNLSRFYNTGECEKKFISLAKKIMERFGTCHRLFSEIILYDHEYKIAGTADEVTKRQKSKTTPHDFYDFKSNPRRGIEFDSISRKKNLIKHYNRYFLPPFDHLEECNYNRTVLQLNSYAYMCRRTYGITVGRLAIIYINLELESFYLPVPYVPSETEKLFRHFSSLNPLPGEITKIIPDFSTSY